MQLGSREEKTQALCSLRGGISDLPMKTSRPPPVQANSVSEDGNTDKALGGAKKKNQD